MIRNKMADAAMCLSVALFGFAAGCGKQAAESKPAVPLSKIDAGQFLLTAEPADAQGVIQVRKSSQDKDDVVVVGRIGGSEVPWIEGRAAFSIVDPSLKCCGEVGADNCPKPWDFC